MENIQVQKGDNPETVSKMAKNFTTMSMMIMLLFLTANSNNDVPQKWTNEPTPTPWPEQFHSLLVSNNSNTNELLVINLWYDWINGRNLNIIQYQLGKKAHNVEHNNGTLYYYFTNDDGTQECRIDEFDVGILTPNWLQGANYLGQRRFDGFDCNVWEKVEFLWYYEDVVTQRPVCWIFYDGMEVHVMTFEVGAVLEDSEWQAPAYCFGKEAEEGSWSIADRHSQQMLRGSVPLSLLALV